MPPGLLRSPTEEPYDHNRLIIGHRGAAGLIPENTLPSFIEAVRLGVDAVELDVHLCEDRLCVIHDADLARTTNGRGKVWNQSLQNLRLLDAGDGAQIPFLEEVFDVIPVHIGINVELKGRDTAAPLAKMLRQYPAAQVLVSSFNHAELERFRELAPDVPVAPLFDRWLGDPLAVAAKFCSRFINLGAKLVTPQRCRMLLDAQLQILVYTVNDPSLASKLFAIGVSGIFTDYPDRMTDLRGDRSPD
jgi:glycerophosphoryl diester phosphodiesterase